MRILVPTADYPPIEGGISTVTRHVSRELAELGHVVSVVAPSFPNMQDFDRGEAPICVDRFAGYNLGLARIAPMAARCLPKLRRCDLILGINASHGGLIALAARRLRGTPYIALAYGYEFLKFHPRSPAAAILRAVYRHATVVIAISHFTRDKLVRFGVDASRIAVCLPGADAAKPSSISPQAIRKKFGINGHRIIFSVGRMVPRKGHLTLVRAMPRVLERHPDAMLVCAGRGPCRDEAKHLARELGLADHVRFPGHVADDDIAAFYQACDLFALPAGAGPRGQVEGFGLVFAEAAARGKPVIAGRSGGMTDAVVDGETGLLVEPDDPGATARAIGALLADPGLARRMGEAGRRRVERELNWPTFTRAMLDAYAQRA